MFLLSFRFILIVGELRTTLAPSLPPVSIDVFKLLTLNTVPYAPYPRTYCFANIFQSGVTGTIESLQSIFISFLHFYSSGSLDCEFPNVDSFYCGVSDESFLRNGDMPLSISTMSDCCLKKRTSFSS